MYMIVHDYCEPCNFYLRNLEDEGVYFYKLNDWDWDYVSNIIKSNMLTNYWSDGVNGYIFAINKNLLHKSGSEIIKEYHDNIKLKLMGRYSKLDDVTKSFTYKGGVLFNNVFTFKCIDFNRWCSSKLLSYKVCTLSKVLSRVYVKDGDKLLFPLLDGSFIESLQDNDLGGFSSIQEISINNEWYYVFTSDKYFTYIPILNIFDKNKHKYVSRS